MDNWKAVWDWAEKVWGDNSDYSFHRFFNRVANARAEYEGWEEVGSSDVWHCSFHCVKTAMESGKVDNREALKQYVCDYQGVWE